MKFWKNLSLISNPVGWGMQNLHITTTVPITITATTSCLIASIVKTKEALLQCGRCRDAGQLIKLLLGISESRISAISSPSCYIQ